MAPTLTKLLKPTCVSRAQSRIDVQMAPLWLSRATLPGRAIVGGEAGVEVARRVDDAQAVGADDAHLAAGDVADLLFERPALGAEFGEAGRDDDRRRHAALDAVGDQVPGTVAAGVAMTARSTASGTAARIG